MKVGLGLANASMQNFATELTGSFIYIFSGAIPVDADAALDMVSVHTQLVKLAADAVPVVNGVTGIAFEATATNRAISKLAAQTWAGVNDFTGFEAAQTTLTGTFWRLCQAGDNGQAAGLTSNRRLQGTLGVAGAELILTSAQITRNGTNVTAANFAQFRVA